MILWPYLSVVHSVIQRNGGAYLLLALGSVATSHIQLLSLLSWSAAKTSSRSHIRRHLERTITVSVTSSCPNSLELGAKFRISPNITTSVSVLNVRETCDRRRRALRPCSVRIERMGWNNTEVRMFRRENGGSFGNLYSADIKERERERDEHAAHVLTEHRRFAS